MMELLAVALFHKEEEREILYFRWKDVFVLDRPALFVWFASYYSYSLKPSAQFPINVLLESALVSSCQ